MNRITKQATNDFEKQFLKKFNFLCQSRSNWQVWTDFITVSAITLANSIDKTSEVRDEREKEYENCIKRLGGVDIPAEMFSIVVLALEENPEQDFLGSMFMKLGLGNHWKGQFFTPYNVCKMMSEINSINIEKQISEKGWVSVNDPACGAGATLISMANILKDHKINYQNHALFVAQDIDRVAGMMCYIQLSLLGCAGYVVIADTLCNPLTGNILRPNPNKNQEIWFTPMYISNVWCLRRIFNQ